MGEKYGYGLKRKVSLPTGKSIKQEDCRGYITEHSFRIISDSLIGSIVKTSVELFTAWEMDMMEERNLFSEIADSNIRQEILDWYHLKENLYKIQAPKKFLVDIEAELWHGQVELAITKLNKTKYVGVTQFTNYLRKHASRLVNYMYFQAEQLSSVGSGAVESAVKQIDKRLQIVGAQWKYENLPQMLSLRCAYLNGFLAPTF
jgi:hypothetical protein